MPRILLFVASLLLSACAAHTPVPQTPPALVAPLPLSLQIQREQAQVRQDWLLVIQREGSALRWSLMDPLGIPQARQLLDAGHWRNDGLLPPNAEARELLHPDQVVFLDRLLEHLKKKLTAEDTEKR